VRPFPRLCAIALAFAALWGAASARAAAGPMVALDPAVTGGFPIALARAALEQSAGHPRAVIAQLEPVDLAAQVGPDRDRAAFLLGHAYLELGSRTRFRRVAVLVVAWNSPSPYAAWFARRLALLDAEEGHASPGAAAPPADSMGASRRGALLVSAAAAMDEQRWEDAAALYARAGADWSGEQVAWRSLVAANDPARVWAVWERGAVPGDASVLDASTVRAEGDALLAAACDLTGSIPASSARAVASSASVVPGAPGTTLASLGVPPPMRADWEAERALDRLHAETGFDLAGTRGALADEEARLAAQRRYVAFGAGQARAERAAIERAAARLAALSTELAATRAELDSVSAQATRRVLARAAGIAQRAEDHRVALEAMRHFRLDGPERTRARAVPPGVPTADSLTRAELALAADVQAFAGRMTAQAPGLIARSAETSWRSGLLDRVLAQAALLSAQARTARALAGGLDSTLATLDGSAERTALLARADSLTAALAALERTQQEARARAVSAALAHALAGLDAEREAIDYGLASASYAASARYAAGDSFATDSIATAWRTRAAAQAEAFLARYPTSAAGGQMRFRLADVLLADPAHGGPARARTLYEAILAEDSTFAHRDAAMLNLASVLREAGDLEGADRRLTALLETMPASDFAPEAHVELGDRALEFERWSEAEAHFAAAASAPGPLVAMARYKQGFAALKRGDAPAGAEAFAQLLALPDLSKETQADGLSRIAWALRDEGGAPAAERFLAAHDNPPYAHALLLALAQQENDDGAFDRAAETWRAALARDPALPENVQLAQRILAAWDARGRKAESLDARLDLGRWFAPGAPGASAGPKGAAFGAHALLEAAFLVHEDARAKKDNAGLDHAVALYREVERLYPASDSLALAYSSEGEALFDLARFGEAAEAHERALTASGATPERRREAAFGAALARERAAAAVAYRRAGERDALEHAIERLESEAPRDPRVPPLWLSLALGSSDHDDPARARRVFEHVAGRDTSEASRRSQAELGRIALSENRWLDGEKQYAAAASSYGSAGDRAEQARLVDLAASSLFKGAEDQMAHGDTLGAAGTFAAVADRYPKFARSDVALYRAGLASLAGGKPHAADEHFARLRERFPASGLAGDALLKRGEAALAASDTLGAARVLAQGGALARGDSLGLAAQEEAARLFRAGGASDQAETAYRRLAHEAPDGRARARALANLGDLQYERGRRADAMATLAPWRAKRFPASLAADPDADARARFTLGRVLADSCLALAVTNPVQASLHRKLAALGPALEQLKAAAKTTDSPFWGESGLMAGRLLEDLGTRVAALPPPSAMSAADSAGYRGALEAQARTFWTRAEDLWIAALEGLPAPADSTTRPREGWAGRIWERLEPRLVAHYPWRLAVEDEGDATASVDAGGELVASLEPTALSAAPAPDSLGAEFAERQDVAARSQEVARLLAAGELEPAERATASAVAAHPRRAECWNDRGAALHRLDRWAEAEAAWTQALALDPNAPAPLLNRAVFERFYRLDRAAARRDFERFLTLGATFDESLADRMAEEKAK
jgi:TolA-binding protein